jgi:methylenetetrahydrofolate dehydrogenase (NADP+) / methenyltetrahydrofolate cyclohydrolase
MSLLGSKDIVIAIKARQAKQVATLAKRGVQPRLAIVLTVDHPAIQAYTKMKKKYGADLGAVVDIHRVAQAKAPALITRLNADNRIHAIILQLPIERPEETDKLVAMVAPHKDVDGLGPNPAFEPATPLAILLLLQGYKINLKHKKVLLIGRGRLVGTPLARMLQADGVAVAVGHSKTLDLKAEALNADVIITATGRPGILTVDMVRPHTVVVDAGVAGEQGKTVGDVDPKLYDRDDIAITPPKGGVGPLTVCALFENTIKAAERSLTG